jgi:hypothetical protein
MDHAAYRRGRKENAMTPQEGPHEHIRRLKKPLASPLPDGSMGRRRLTTRHKVTCAVRWRFRFAPRSDEPGTTEDCVKERPA